MKYQLGDKVICCFSKDQKYFDQRFIEDVFNKTVFVIVFVGDPTSEMWDRRMVRIETLDSDRYWWTEIDTILPYKKSLPKNYKEVT